MKTFKRLMIVQVVLLALMVSVVGTAKASEAKQLLDRAEKVYQRVKDAHRHAHASEDEWWGWEYVLPCQAGTVCYNYVFGDLRVSHALYKRAMESAREHEDKISLDRAREGKLRVEEMAEELYKEIEFPRVPVKPGYLCWMGEFTLERMDDLSSAMSFSYLRKAGTYFTTAEESAMHCGYVESRVKEGKSRIEKMVGSLCEKDLCRVPPADLCWGAGLIFERSHSRMPCTPSERPTMRMYKEEVAELMKARDLCVQARMLAKVCDGDVMEEVRIRNTRIKEEIENYPERVGLSSFVGIGACAIGEEILKNEKRMSLWSREFVRQHQSSDHASVDFETQLAETFSESCSILRVAKKFYEKAAEAPEKSDGDAGVISFAKQRVLEMQAAIDELTELNSKSRKYLAGFNVSDRF